MSLDTAKLGAPVGGYASVFDVGAFRGDFARACHAAWPNAHVECFEPLLPNPDQTPAATSEAFVGWVTWHQVALGAERNVAAMHECEFLPSSSLLEMREEHKEAFPYTREHTLRPVSVETIFDYRSAIRRPALLKIDTQGYELEVLYGACPALYLFDAVVLEVSHETLYEGAPSFRDIDDFLREWCFRHARRLDELRHPKTKTLLQSDELWLR